MQFSNVIAGLSAPQPLSNDPRHREQCGTCAEDQELHLAGAVVPRDLSDGLNTSAGVQAGSLG